MLLLVIMSVAYLDFGSNGILAPQVAFASSPNLALNKSVTASAGSVTPELAVDGSYGTGWYNTNTGDRWLRIDLGAATTFNRWKIKHAQASDDNPAYNTKDFVLQISNDGSAFTNVDAVSGNTQGITNRLLSPQTARYARILITAPNQGMDTIVRILEVELFNDTHPSSNNYYYFDMKSYINSDPKSFYPGRATEYLAESAIPSGRYIKLNISRPSSDAFNTTARVPEFELYYNLAMAKSVAASSYLNATTRPEAAVDGGSSLVGVPETKWVSSGASANSTLTVDLGQTKTIKRWAVRHAEAGGEPASLNTRDFALQVSTDGVNFTNADSVSGNTGAVTERSITGATGRYFRLNITTPSQNGDLHANIYEFELYDQGNLLTNKTVIASSGHDGANVPGRAIDGNAATSWVSTGTPASWLKIDLGSVMKFNRVVLKNDGYSGGPQANNTVAFEVLASAADVDSSYKGFIGAGSYTNTTYPNAFDRSFSTQLYKKYAYDMITLLTALQGVVNRDTGGPKILYKYFSTNPEYLSGYNSADYWLDGLTDPGNLLAGKTRITVTDPFVLIDAFAYKFGGLVLWDEAVPATSNVANTIAGVEDLLPVRYDASVNSLYSDIMGRSSLGLTPSVYLNGKFTGSGTIWNSSTTSTGSKKNDAYIWAKEKYINTGKANARLLAYYIDAWTTNADKNGNIAYPNSTDAEGELNDRGLIVKDYFIRNKAFFLDLQPERNPGSVLHKPNDDPSQPLGTDYNTLSAILDAARAQSGTDPITAGGYLPWKYKYTDFVDATADTVSSVEIAQGHMFSQRLIQFDADAIGMESLANASVYQDIPLDGNLHQSNDGDSSVTYDPAKKYIMLYMGDYDNAAWAGSLLPGIWDKTNGRGRIPLSWPVSPVVSKRAPMVFNKLYAEASQKDYFTGSDSSGAYIYLQKIPSPYLQSYKTYLAGELNKFDIDSTGLLFVTEDAPMTAETYDVLSELVPNGVGWTSAEKKLVQGVPYVPVISPFINESASFVEKTFYDYMTAILPNEQFYFFRTVIQDPKQLADAIDALHADFPALNFEVVDQYAFFRLYRQSLIANLSNLSFPANGKGTETSVLFEDDGSTVMDGNSRYASAANSWTYKFDLDDAVSDATAYLDIGGDYIVSGSRDNANWTVLADPGSVMPRADVTVDLNALLSNNPNKQIYLKFTDGAADSNMGARLYHAEIDTNRHNIVLNKPATASGQVNAESAAAKAVDGSIDNQWCSIDSAPHWLTVDLGANYSISRWVVKHAHSAGDNALFNTRDFKLQVSSDGVNFTDADTVTGNAADITDRNVTVSGRYVRLYITQGAQNGQSNFARIRDFEVYGAIQKNVALGKTATASGQVDASSGPANAVDGLLTNHWCSIDAAPHWLSVDLGRVYNLSRWVVKHAHSGGDAAAYNTKNFKLQVSNDGTNFTDVDSVTGNTADITNRNIAASGRYVRLYITQGAQDGQANYARIRDFEVYGK